MELKLYRVPGISKTDTPYFANSSAQLAYFESKLLATIKPNDFYYPPFYEDVIKVEWDTYRLYRNANYLSFTFNGLVCYYFINSINYLNESVWELHVEMDIIQTFYFMINFHSGMCERRHIPRWVKPNPVATTYQINRSYVRENVSNNILIPQEKNFIAKFSGTNNLSDKEIMWIGVRINSIDRAISGGGTVQAKIITNVSCQQSNVKYKDCHLYVFIPLLNTLQHIVTIDGDTRETYSDLLEILENYVDSSNVDEIIVYKGQPFSNNHAYISSDRTTLYINLAYSDTLWDSGHEVMPIGFIPKMVWVPNDLITHTGGYYKADLQLKHKGYTAISSPYSFARITGTNSPTSIQNEPCLLDENYMQLSYGDGTSQKTYPTFNAKFTAGDTNLHLYISYMFGLEDGSVTLFLNEDGNSLDVNDRYETLLVLTDNLNMDIMTSPWKEYVSNNKNRYITAGLKSAINTSETIISIVASYGMSKIASDAIKSNRKMYQPKRGGLTAKASRRLDQIQGSTFSDVSKTAISGLTDMMPGVSQIIEDKNMQSVPYKTSSLGNGSSILNFTINIYYQWFVVQNIGECAKFYIMYGNKVNELWSASTSSTLLSDLFTSYNVRYYFNYFKFNSLNVELSYFDSIEKREQLEDRLMAGIRLWNVANRDVIGDYSLDNVERSFIS